MTKFDLVEHVRRHARLMLCGKADPEDTRLLLLECADHLETYRHGAPVDQQSRAVKARAVGL